MWPFSQHKSIADSGVLRGFSDAHSHLLPGVDDGVQTLEETLHILARYEEAGIREVWLTPHIMEDIPNTPAALRRQFAELLAAYGGTVALHLASENMLDNLFMERLEKEELLPWGETGRHLLVETSYFNPPMGLGRRLQRIREKGYTPILAHPERYTYMEKADYRRLKEQPILFQLNLPALAGMYGAEVKEKAEWLLKNHLYDLAGSDTHRLAAWEETVGKKHLTGNVLQLLKEMTATHSPRSIDD